jgi:hypothetical protein
VRFPWDRADTDLSGHYTCWLRVGRTWAGQTAPAFLFIPRVGMEVIVSFVDGDPDRPLVIGCVYNGDSATPAMLPPQATKSIIRTRTIPMGTGYNELSFEDAVGMERVFPRAERDLAVMVQHNRDSGFTRTRAFPSVQASSRTATDGSVPGTVRAAPPPRSRSRRRVGSQAQPASCARALARDCPDHVQRGLARRAWAGGSASREPRAPFGMAGPSPGLVRPTLRSARSAKGVAARALREALPCGESTLPLAIATVG